MRSKGILLDDDDFEIFEEDVKISSNGPFPEIFFSDRIHEILDQSMEQTIVVRLLGRSIGYRASVDGVWLLLDCPTMKPYFFTKEKHISKIVVWTRLLRLLVSIIPRSCKGSLRAMGRKRQPTKMGIKPNKEKAHASDKVTIKKMRFNILVDLERVETLDETNHRDTKIQEKSVDI
ncbi:hypothetical protein Goari_019114 [Gossypium aridum]|uniref:DUF4283 domain-containing protein n=1 Tax=Gossypium aridum TaxID=34290 RepID=A0A7J8WS02_GOSAI|nr:hypothetical protein [Gossypium aridum]